MGTAGLDQRLASDAKEAGLAHPVLCSLNRQQLEDLVVDLSKRWLAHDGLWFQAVEADQGLAGAIRYDRTAWAAFTVIEAKRILAFLGLAPGGGLDALAQALPLRLYGFVNTQQMIRVDADTLVLRMNDCRVQAARSRRGLPDFPCKSVGDVAYSEFARAVDPRIGTAAWSAHPTPIPPTSTAPGSSPCRRRGTGWAETATYGPRAPKSARVGRLRPGGAGPC